jgi:chromosome segregation protein
LFLKTLSLKGFKSFAEPTLLEFQPGVTVVVGPNGSGKSNVVDAIGWVLGAQAPSSVRSQKMDDVIFAGTQERAALGRAEVVLTIDNGAGLLPIDFSELTITRTLFRTGDSEYALNGVPCRLLDIQELLSDTGVGRQQHVIVSQGQIDAVLNSRPEDRRLVVEEAAGVLKFRRRKEKAERRLAATEGNLTRLQDLLREVRRQLRPLERQADAARRHGAVTAELQALRLFLAGQQLSRLHQQQAGHQRAAGELSEEDRTTRAQLAGLDEAIVAIEDELSAVGADELGDDLARFESLRERARGLTAVIVERRRGIERDREALVDQTVVATLEEEAARLGHELEQVKTATAELRPEVDRVVAAEAELAEARAALAPAPGSSSSVSGDGGAAVRGELAALRAGLARDEQRAEEAAAALAALDDDGSGASADAEAPLAEQVSVASAAAETARRALADCEAAEQEARAESERWAARAEALALAHEEARSQAGVARLAELDGVLGPLFDLVEVDHGWEAAFEAAAGAALASSIVADEAVGRRAIEALRHGRTAGVVLPTTVLPAETAGTAAAVGERVRDHVRGTEPAVEAVLDHLVGGAVAVPEWPEAVDVALAHPGALVVTAEGDRFGPRGWQVRPSGDGMTKTALEEARRHADSTAGTLTELGRRVATARREADERARALERAEGAARDAELRRRHRAVEAEALRTGVDEVRHRLAADRRRLAELEAAMAEVEAAEAEDRARAEKVAAELESLEARAAAVASSRSELDIRVAGLDERRQLTERRRAEVEQRLTRHTAERKEAEARRTQIDLRRLVTDRLAATVEQLSGTIQTRLEELREARRNRSEVVSDVGRRLDARRRERSELERRLQETGERLQRNELAEAEVRLRLEAAVESLRRDLGAGPDQAAAAERPELADGVTPEARVRELERDLRLMGPINPLALEEYEALGERHTFLEAQLEDVKTTRRELSKVIKGVDAEIERVFVAAYADVADHFAKLFETLFPGGRGRLSLTDPDDLLDTGIELEARPSGKNVKKLSLLSGGERSLTALAYLFAVFRARPSPFYVMDEVEAALDDVNLHRFLGLLHEFRDEAQLIVVSHQKRTMEAADCLYGVTMAPGGSSRVISERVGERQTA